MKAPHEMRPGNRYAREREARKTLADLIGRKATLVAICRHCKHRRLLFPRSLANQLGERSEHRSEHVTADRPDEAADQELLEHRRIRHDVIELQEPQLINGDRAH